MTTLTESREYLDALCTLRSGEGYLSFLEFVMVDAQPRKLPFGEIAEDWQWERAGRIAPALDHLGGVNSSYNGPRSFWNGYHKGSDKTHETARELCWLLGWSQRRLNIVVCAGKEDQAALLTKAMRGIVADNPWIGERVKVTELTARGWSSSEVEILSMNAYGNQGAFPDYIIAEEITHWQHVEGRNFWQSFVLASINKRPECVLNVTTNAGLKGTWQWDERNRAARSRFWSFYEAPVGDPLPSWMDREKIADDSEGMPTGERDRLYKNRWVDPGEEYGYLTESEALLCRDESLVEVSRGSRGSDYWCVIDYGGVHDRCALAVLHNPPGTDTVVVDRLDCWQGSHEDRVAIDADPFSPQERSVEAWLTTVLANFRIVGMVVDPFQLEGLAIKYERRGVVVHRIEYRGGKTNYRLAQVLKTSIQNRKVSWSKWAGLLPPTYSDRGRQRSIEDRNIEQELGMLVTRPMSYGYRFDHESGRHDDRSVCVAMGLLHVLPSALPAGGVGPTVVTRDPKDGYRPPGVVPTHGRKSQWEAPDKHTDPTSLNGSVGRWGMFGMGND